MKNLFKSIDWSKVFSYGAHLGLLAGSIALNTYAPGSAVIWAPVLQAAGQMLASPEGITLLNKPAA
jgi:hypothetical protein